MPERITALTIMRDEAPALLEWVAWQQTIGVDSIIVYTNDCCDGTDAMLDRLAAIGAPVLRRDNPVGTGGRAQPVALRAAQHDPAVIETDWLCVLDADEFPVVKVGARRLQDLVSALPRDTEGVAITWRIMGSNGLIDWNPGLATEVYTRGAPDDFRRGWGVKTLFRPFPGMRLGIHRPTVQGAARDPEARARLRALRWVNGSGVRLTRQFMDGMWRSSAATVGYELAEIAHFAVKSRESYLLRGLRGSANAKADKYDAAYFGTFDRNEIAGPVPRRHLPELRARIADYLADPVLAGLARRATAWHAARIETLRAKPGHAERMDRLAETAAIPIGALDTILFPQPLTAAGKAEVLRLRRLGLPEQEIARKVAGSVARFEAERDARDFRELQERALSG